MKNLNNINGILGILFFGLGFASLCTLNNIKDINLSFISIFLGCIYTSVFLYVENKNN